MSAIFLLVCLTLGLPGLYSIEVAYLDQSCDGSMYTSETSSTRLESDTALSYGNNVDCKFTVTVPSSFSVYVVFRRFELEVQVNGSCVDYVNLHDGGTTSDPTLNSEPLCDDQSGGNYTTSTNQNTLLIHFVTDASAVTRGFDMLFTAIKYAPCDANQFTCNSSVCIPASFECDDYTQCGDYSDEQNCPDTSSVTGIDSTLTLIVGLCIGLGVLLIILGLVGVYVYRYFRWRKFLRTPLEHMKQFAVPSSYPVTNQYHKRGHQYYESVNQNADFSDEDIRKPQKPKSAKSALETSSKA